MLTVRSWPVRDCRPLGFAARKLPFANYGTRPEPGPYQSLVSAAPRQVGSQASPVLRVSSSRSSLHHFLTTRLDLK